MNRIEVVVRASSLHGEREMARLKGRLLSEIGAAGDFSLEEVEFPSGEGLAVILVLTGGVEREVLKLVSQLPSPVLLLAHPGQNSLPACLEILARIRQDGGKDRSCSALRGRSPRDSHESCGSLRPGRRSASAVSADRRTLRLAGGERCRSSFPQRELGD